MTPKLCPAFKTECRKEKCVAYKTSKWSTEYFDKAEKVEKVPKATQDRHYCLREEFTEATCTSFGYSFGVQVSEKVMDENRIDFVINNAIGSTVTHMPISYYEEKTKRAHALTPKEAEE